MSDSELTGNETPEQVRRHLELRGLSREQAQAATQAAAQLAQAQVRRAASVTSSFITTVVALVSSAFGLVAALAWNSAIQQWIDDTFNTNSNSLNGKLVYALIATVVAIIVIAILGFINSRFKGGTNLLTAPTIPPTSH